MGGGGSIGSDTFISQIASLISLTSYYDINVQDLMKKTIKKESKLPHKCKKVLMVHQCAHFHGANEKCTI